MKSFRKILNSLLISILSLLFFAGCSDTIERPAKKENSNAKGYLSINVEKSEYNNAFARTVLPSTTVSEFTDFVLTMRRSDGINNTYTFDNYENLASSSIGIETGDWTFRLTSGDFSCSLSQTITSGTNNLSFCLSYTGSSYKGNVAVTMRLDDERIRLVKCGLLNVNTEQVVSGYGLETIEPISNDDSKSYLYSKQNVPAGYYIIKWSVYGDSEGKVLLDSKKNLLLVGSGLTSGETSSFTDMLDIYNITYNLNGGAFSEGFEPPVGFTSLSDFDLPKERSVKKEGQFFEGWYTSENYSGERVDCIKAGTAENLNLYAKWKNASVKTVERTRTSTDIEDFCLFNLEPEKTIDEIWYFKPGYTYRGIWVDFNTTSESILSAEGYSPVDAQLKFYTENNNLVKEVDDESSFDFSVTQEGYYKVSVTSVFDTAGYCAFLLYEEGNNYSIQYVLNGGTVSSYCNVPNTYSPVQETYLPDNIYLTKPHCIFTGWYETAECNTEPIKRIASGSCGDKVFYAGWDGEIFTIHYVLNGGEVGADDEAFNSSNNPSFYTIEQSVTLENPTRNGYVFAGWYDNVTLGGSRIETLTSGSTGNVTLYAKWLREFNVTYSTSHGTAPAAIIVGEGEKLTSTQLPELTSSDYFFVGWYYGETKILAGNYTIIGNMTLTARWLKKCTVRYETRYGTAPYAITIIEGSPLAAEQLPELTSGEYFFNGWYDGELKVVAGNYTVTDDLTITAKWLKKCTVTYVTTHGATPSAITVAEGDTFTLAQLPDLTERNWVFNGWYVDINFTETNKCTSGYTVTTNLTLYAKWEEFSNPEENFVLVNGGTIVGSNDNTQSFIGVFPEGRIVTLDSFYMSDHELTQSEYKAVMGTNPCIFNSSSENGGINWNRPVENISWYDAIYFCNKYSIIKGLTPCYAVNGNVDISDWGYTPHDDNNISGTITCNLKADGYRLPTEAEWEYAARGGQKAYGTVGFTYYFSGASTTDTDDVFFSNNDLSDVAWYEYSANNETHEVKKKLPNVLDLYDMSGNVWEWCWDRYSNSEVDTGTVTNPCGSSSGSERVLRGGGWNTYAIYCSVCSSSRGNPAHRNDKIGIRLVRSDLSGRIVKAYSIKYISTHGTTPETLSFKGETLTNFQLPELTEEGLSFKGWYKDRACTENNKVTSGYAINGNLTLYAKWEEGDGFVFVEGGTIAGSFDYYPNRDWNLNSTGVFIGAFPYIRTVTLSSFYISDHELTQGEFETYCYYTTSAPSSEYGKGENYPAYNVSWYDALVYCNLKSMDEGLSPCYFLSGETDPKKWIGVNEYGGKYSCSYTSYDETYWDSILCDWDANGYRLPTEAEWEYAARGGQETYGTDVFVYEFAGASSINEFDTVAWNNHWYVHKVKTKLPNALGLYDMSGNVSEWCWDKYGTNANVSTINGKSYEVVGSGNVTDPTGVTNGIRMSNGCFLRITRGGPGVDIYCCSVSYRGHLPATFRDFMYGFRLVRSAR